MDKQTATREIILEFLRQNQGLSFTPSEIAFTLAVRFALPVHELALAVTSLAADCQVKINSDWRITHRG